MALYKYVYLLNSVCYLWRVVSSILLPYFEHVGNSDVVFQTKVLVSRRLDDKNKVFVLVLVLRSRVLVLVLVLR